MDQPITTIGLLRADVISGTATATLNIWVCELGSGLLGFATPPGANANRDGVVVGYEYFGTIGTATSPFNKGRTATHEVGHWLNLDHMWGGGFGGCSDDDGISDTPTSDSPYYGCPGFPQTSCGSSDMHMNYMDYVNDACMNLFTDGQANVMQATLNTVRSSIKSSLGCGNCPAINLSFNTVYCGTDPGTSTVSVSGGTPPYTYQWSNGASSSSATNLNPGTYTVTITDGNGCTTLSSTIVPVVNNPLAVNVTTNNAIGGNCDGSASALASGGTPPYNHSWTSGANTVTASNLCPGSYTVAVTDDIGCAYTETVTIEADEPVGISDLMVTPELNLYPNPSTGIFTAELKGNVSGGVEVSVFNVLGQPVWRNRITGSQSAPLQIDLSVQSKGVYFVRFEGENWQIVRRAQLIR